MALLLLRPAAAAARPALTRCLRSAAASRASLRTLPLALPNWAGVASRAQAEPRRRPLSSAAAGVSEDTFAVWVQWEDWLLTGRAMDDPAEQEEFLAVKKMDKQQYFLHAGPPEFSPFQPLHERLYRVADNFTEEAEGELTVHADDVVELLEVESDEWWRVQLFAGEHHYEGAVPANVMCETPPDEEEADRFAMGRSWHGDSEGSFAFQEDTEVRACCRPAAISHPLLLDIIWIRSSRRSLTSVHCEAGCIPH